MRFILSEYITLLKEDGELDTLITDLLMAMKITPISKPQRGRQHGVDIAAVGIDPEDGKRKVFLFVVKQKNLTRSSWNKEVNSVRPSLDEVIDVYIPTMLDKRYKKLPIKIVVATNGEMVQNVQINWKNYVDNNSKKKRKYAFWGTGTLVDLLDTYLATEKLFPVEYQSLLRKTLAFIDLPDYNLSHYYELLEKILSVGEKQRQKILKRQRLVRLCLGIVFKWSQDIDNLKPALIASERTLLLSWDWIARNHHFEKNYVQQEFYFLYELKRKIGIEFYNKVHKHYKVRHSLYRYSKNYIEYSLNSWEQLGILASIGLTEIQHFKFAAATSPPEITNKIYRSALAIADSLGSFVLNNPPLNYPKYDEHSIEIAISLQLLCQTGKVDIAKRWINNLVVSFHNNYKVDKDFPMFRTNFDKLVDIHNGDDTVEITSSTIITLLVEYAIVLQSEELYHQIRELVKEQFPKINLQIWFATEDIEGFIASKCYSQNQGTLKHSIVIYKDIEAYKKEVFEEMDLYIKEDNFQFFKAGYHIIGHLSSRHYRAQPFPIFWRRAIKLAMDEEKNVVKT